MTIFQRLLERIVKSHHGVFVEVFFARILGKIKAIHQEIKFAVDQCR